MDFPAPLPFFLAILLALSTGVQAQDLSFLESNANADGGIYTSNDLATPAQSTAHSVLTYQTLGAADDPVVEAARDSLPPPSEQSSTETVALWLATRDSDESVGLGVSELLRRQNRDGGFGYWEGYASEPFSTGLALFSLAEIGQLNAEDSARAVNYLMETQSGEGGWSIPGGNRKSVEVTAWAAHSLWLYRQVYDVSSAVDDAAAYLEAQRGAQLWESVEASALALEFLLKRRQQRSDYLGEVEALTDLQQSNGSFSDDVYQTSLALRVLNAASSPPPDATVIRGKVVDGEFGQPLAGADIVISGPQEERLTADSSGMFEAEGLPPGAYSLSVSREQFGTLSLKTTLQVGTRLDMGSLTLSRLEEDPDSGEPVTTGILRGQVTERVSGEPLAGATVGVVNQSVATETDAQGRYVLSSLDPGDLQVTVSAPGFQSVSTTPALQERQTLVFSPALLKSQDPAVRLRGTIAERGTGAPLQDVSIVVHAGSNQYSTVSGSEGKYSLSDLPSGEIVIEAQVEGFHPVSVSVSAKEGDRLNFSPRMDRLADEPQEDAGGVTGQVVDGRTGQGLQDVEVTLAYSGAQSGDQVITGHDGNIVFNELSAGEAKLTLEKAGYHTVEASLEITAGITIDIDQIKLTAVDSLPTTEVIGRVIDVRTERPVPNAIISANSGGSVVKEAISDSDGLFNIDALPSGDYLFSIKKDGYVDNEFAVTTDESNYLNLGDLQIRTPGIDALLPDLVVRALSSDALQYNQKNFSVSGTVSGVIANKGNDKVITPVDIVAFEDRDGDGQYSGADRLLARETLNFNGSHALSVDSEQNFELSVNGELRFYQAPIVVMVDEGEVLAELSKVNNVATTARSCGALEGPAVDLALCMDGSGSISSSDFKLQMQATADALENEEVMPRDGSVRLSLLQFAGYTDAVIPPTVVDADTVGDLADAVRSVGQRGSGTPMASCINQATDLLLDATPASTLQVIDISTDGAPDSRTRTRRVAEASQEAGVDAINAIGVGSGADINFLESIVFPQPAGGERGFVVDVNSFEEYIAAISQKIQKETQTVDITVGGLDLVDNGYGQAADAQLVIGNAGLGEVFEPVVVRLYDGDPEQGATMLREVEYAQGLGAGDTASVEIEGVEPTDLQSGALVAVVEIANGIPECDQNNNRQTIEVLSSSGSVALTLDGTAYGPDNEVLLSSLVRNTGALDGNYRLDVAISDSEGNIVQRFESRTLADVEPDGQLIVDDRWETGSTLAGQYRAKAELLDSDGNVLDDSVQPFSISEPDSNLAAQVRASTDRPVYHVDDTVLLEMLVENTSAITQLNSTRLQARVKDADGVAVYEEELTPASMAPGQVLTFEREVSLHQSVLGDYEFQLTLMDGDDVLRAQANTSFEVVNDQRAAVTGRVEVERESLSRGDVQTCQYSLSNSGVADIETIIVYQRLVSVDDEDDHAIDQQTVSLPSAESWQQGDTFTTSDLLPGTYACVLQADLGDQRVTMDSATFTVLEAPIQLQTRVTTPSDPKLLVWVDALSGAEPGTFQGQPDLAEQTALLRRVLDELDVYYVVVDSVNAFARELRSGHFNQYLLLAEQSPLPAELALELEQSVIAGGGAVLTADALTGQPLVEALSGARLADQTPDALSLQLEAGGLFSGANHLPLVPDNTLQSLHLEGAQLQAGFKLTSGEWQFEDKNACRVYPLAPAVVSHDHGIGTAFTGGLDWLLQAASNSDWTPLLAQVFQKSRSSGLALFTGESIPVGLSVDSSTGVSGRLTAMFPEGVSVDMPDGWVLSPEGQWQRNFTLADNGGLDEEWLVFPSQPGDYSVTVTVEYEEEGEYRTHETIEKRFNVQTPLSNEDLVAMLDERIQQTPRNAFLKLARSELNEAGSALRSGDSTGGRDYMEKAMTWLAQSGRPVLDVRVALAHRYLRLLQQGQ